MDPLNTGETPGRTPYERLKIQGKALGRNMAALLAMAPSNDPFFVGAPAQARSAEWFARWWHAIGYEGQTVIHLRRVHYRISGDARRYDEDLYMPGKEAKGIRSAPAPAMPYENTEDAWDYLISASKYARHLGLVDANAFVDNRAPKPHIYMYGSPPVPEIEVESDGSWYLPEIPTSWSLSADISLPTATVRGYDYHVSLEPYLVELWIEKSTMNDILIPLCRRYGVNLVTGVGQMSISSARRLLERAKEHDKPVRILYASDFDAAGNSIPVTPSRQVEYALAGRGQVDEMDELPADIRLETVVLSREQVEEYGLPPVPLKGDSTRFMERHGVDHGAELDALESEHPGELRRLFEERILQFRDPELRYKVEEAKEEAQRMADAELRRRLQPYIPEIESIKAETEAIAERYRPRLEETGPGTIY
jgi:hypothetical protein